MTTIRSLAASHPIGAAVGLLLIALLFRAIDLFLLRLDERWGEIILSKILGTALVLVYAGAVLGGLRAIGMHSERLSRSLSIGAVTMAALFVVAYGAQLAALALRRRSASLVLAAIDPKTGLTGGALFAAFLVVGNIVNAIMEEGLFRGVMLPVFGSRLPFWPANLAQAALFVSWHLVWPVKHLLSGQTSPRGARGEAASLMGATFIAGLAFGYMFHATNSLWTPVMAHAINNTVYNFLHVRTVAGLDRDLLPAQVVGTVGLVPLMLLVRILAR